MKYVIVATPRAGGSGKDNEESQRRALELLSKWQPSATTTIHQFVTRIDGGGGFAVGETDNPDDLLEVASIFSPYFDYQIYPVVDFAGAHSHVSAGYGVQGLSPDTPKGSLLAGGPFTVRESASLCTALRRFRQSPSPSRGRNGGIGGSGLTETISNGCLGYWKIRTVAGPSSAVQCLFNAGPYTTASQVRPTRT